MWVQVHPRPRSFELPVVEVNFAYAPRSTVATLPSIHVVCLVRTGSREKELEYKTGVCSRWKPV